MHTADHTLHVHMSQAEVRFGTRTIFRDLSFAICKGETMAILGPNGRGKTTLLKSLLGSQRLAQGQRSVPKLIGYVPQHQHGSENHQCIDVVLMARAALLPMFSLPSRHDQELALQALDRVGAAHLAQRYYGSLSGGERQIVLLARALATGADLLILDEPAAALDLANQDLLLGVLFELRRQRSHTVIFTTHHPQHALYLADKALLMHANEKIRFGLANELLTEAELSRLYNVTLRRIMIKTGEHQQNAICPLFGLRGYHSEPPCAFSEQKIFSNPTSLHSKEFAMKHDTISFLENNQAFTVTFDELLKYHGQGSPGGLAHGLKAMQRAWPLLDDGRLPERREVHCFTAFSGKGGRDAIEFVTRGLTDGRFVLDKELGPGTEESSRGRYYFRFEYRGKVVEVTARPGHVRQEYIQLARTENRTPEDNAALAELRLEMSERLIVQPAEEIYDAEVVSA